ncbi:MAG: peptide MFS transporter, partial [Vibrionaceae bacterium]
MTTPSQQTWLGHPKGLFFLFSSELWERFSYYGMRAILVLYLADQTVNGGLGWTQVDALKLYGIYTALVYITPLIGGWLADTYLGQRRSIIIGAVLMAIGQFTLALPHSLAPDLVNVIFYVGLAFIILGNGLFKPNISTMVGDLYETGDSRRDGAFTIFYMGINIGSFLAGIVCGFAAMHFGWQAAFVCAGIGMVLSLIIQAFFASKYLGDVGIIPAAKKRGAHSATALTKEELDRIKVILILGLFTIIFWAGFEQAGGLMNLYAQNYTDRMIGGFEVPTAWFQSLNPFFIIIFAPLVAMLWVKMGKNEPTSPVKFALGLIFLAIGFLSMVGAVLDQDGDMSVKTSMFWLVGAYMFHTLGELCLSPIGLSMVTKLAPLRLASLMMGAWFGFNALANYAAGMIGSFVGNAGAMAVFGGIALAAVVSAVILLLFANRLVYWMHGAEGVQQEKSVQPEQAAA